MDKWFKDILPDKDPYHNRGRDLNIDKYFVCESRDMSDESGTYIILLKL
jgi:hypothetical protein